MMRACAIAVAMLAAGCQTVDLKPKSSHVVAVEAFTWEGETFTAGDRVVVTSRAGTFKPHDTGAEKEVNAAPGRTGILLGGAVRSADSRASEDEPIQLALVRWDAQTWDRGTETVELGEFEATIHSEYLDVVKK